MNRRHVKYGSLRSVPCPYRAPKLRVLYEKGGRWVEERFPTETKAAARALELRRTGNRVVHCSD